jgi:hypothetical protein
MKNTYIIIYHKKENWEQNPHQMYEIKETDSPKSWRG